MKALKKLLKLQKQHKFCIQLGRRGEEFTIYCLGLTKDYHCFLVADLKEKQAFKRAYLEAKRILQ